MIVAISVLSGALCAIFYLIGIYNEIYWKKRGVKFYIKNRVIGPMAEFFISNRPLFDIFNDIYKMYPNEPAIGIGSLLSPTLYVRDPTNVQHVLQLDFNSFSHRGLEVNEGDQLGDNILFMNGNRWKLMRQSMSPLFTSAKLRNMYYIMDRSAQDFVDFIKKNPENLKGNMFNTLCTFCCAAIGAAVFGIGSKSIFESPFLNMTQKALKPSSKRNIKFAMNTLSKKLYKIMGITLFKEHEKFFISAIKQVIRQREQEQVKRHDFADICVKLQNNGALKDHSTGLELFPTDELLAAQAFFFFLAGVEPNAVVMFSTLAELGQNPEILRRVHNEIDEVFEKCDNKITFEIVQKMEYLEMVCNETMRMYPPIGFLTRECVRDTILPVGNIKVEKGTKIYTPIFEIHHDPKLFPDPEIFKPERFSHENLGNTLDNTFMPFGKGNRHCIGRRYAVLQMKSGLIHLLRNFTVKSHIDESGVKYCKQHIQVRANNLSVVLMPRNIKHKV